MRCNDTKKRGSINMHISRPAFAEDAQANFWPRVLAVLHAELGEHRYRMWIAPISLKSADQDRVVLHCATQFHHANVQEKFGDRISALIAQISRLERRVDFVLDRPAPQPRDPQPLFDGSVATVALPVKRTTVDTVKRYVADKYGLSQADIESKSRKRELVRPRQVAMYIARQLTDQSYPQIARRFGRDHSTILHGDRLIAKLIAENPAFAAEVDALMRSIRDSNPS
jgi:chromosomal replication initiation ATPase DnaA